MFVVSSSIRFFVFFFKQKTAYEMRISDWSSDVCSSDLKAEDGEVVVCSRRDADEQFRIPQELRETHYSPAKNSWVNKAQVVDDVSRTAGGLPDTCSPVGTGGQTGCFMQAGRAAAADRSEEHTSELQSLMRNE